MAKNKNIKRNLIIGAVILGALALGYFGFSQSIGSECGSFSGTGSTYYYANINGEYWVASQNDYVDIEDKRFTFRDLETVVESVDSFNENKRYNPTPKIEWAKCTVGDYAPHRCSNPYSKCVGVPQSEIEEIRLELNPVIEEEETEEEEIEEEITEEVVPESEIEEGQDVVEVECTSNVECQSLCGTKTPTCEDNSCFCGGEQVFLIEDKTPVYFYIIPVVLVGLVALIIWQKRKKPKRRRK